MNAAPGGNPGGVPATAPGDGQQHNPATLGQLKEALRVLESTHALFNGMKAKVVYACGEGHLLAADEGRQYLARVIKTLDEEHRTIRANWPRLEAATEVARAASKTRRQLGGPGSPGGSAGGRTGGVAGAEVSATATAATALQGHCRSVVTALDAAVTEALLAGAAAEAALERKAKRQRTNGPTAASPSTATVDHSATSPTSAPAATSPTPMPYSPPRTSGWGAAAASASSSSPARRPLDLLGVLLRLRALDGPGKGVGSSSSSSSSSNSSLLGGVRLHVLDDGGNPLSLPSMLTAAMAAAVTAGTGAAAAGGAQAGGAGGGSDGGVSGGVLSGSWLQQVDGVLLAAGAARISAATQVRMLLPGVFVANVLLEAPGSAAPLRVVVDSADRAFDLDPWATPTTQVFRRVSALATRVLTYYIKRAPLTAPPPSSASAATATISSSPQHPQQVGSPMSITAPGGGGVSSNGGGGGGGVGGMVRACSPGPGGAALEDLLLWLLGCRDLFSKRCTATGRLMAWDPSVQFPVPPIFRPFKLPREELRLRALDLSRVAAYHMHVAPVEQLGWAEDVPAQAVAALADTGSGNSNGVAGGSRVGGGGGHTGGGDMAMGV